MKPKYKFIVTNLTSISSIEDKSNNLLRDYDNVDIQSMVIYNNGIIVTFKVVVPEKDDLVDEE
jgi:hypothetical protein